MKQCDKDLAHELMELAFRLKAKKHDMFVQYSPHVEWIDVSVHVGGWHKDTNSDPQFQEYFPLNGSEGTRLKFLRFKKWIKEEELLVKRRKNG